MGGDGKPMPVARWFTIVLIASWTASVLSGCAAAGPARKPAQGPHPSSTPARTGSDAARLAHTNEPLDAARDSALLRRNLNPAVSLPETLLANRIAAWRAHPLGERVSLWARLFASRTDNTYLFGLKPGGYVADSLLVQDHKLDCVLLFYRCTELARAVSPRQAIEIALGTRFAGGDPRDVVTSAGGVNYDSPAHLDYSLDIVRSGTWGRDVTREVGDAVADTTGLERSAPGTFYYVPTEKLHPERLHDGDLLFFVLNEKTEHGRKMREMGIKIGHQGIAHVDGGTAYTLHAAAKPLSGIYAGNRVVEVPLLTYLRRVDNFKGIIVTRLDDSGMTGSE